MAALGCVSQLVLNLQFVLLQSPPPAFPKNNRKNENKETIRGGSKRRSWKNKAAKGVKGKANQQTSIFKNFCFSTLLLFLFNFFFIFHFYCSASFSSNRWLLFL